MSRASLSRNVPKLPSRGGGEADAAPATVSGQLGVVTGDDVPIIAGREQFSRLLSKVGKGTSLVVTGEEASYYAVVMADGSLGFVPKDQVQLLDYPYTASLTSLTQERGPKGMALISTALQYLHQIPYRYGGTTIHGIDCSAFVMEIYATQGMTLPRTAAEQANVGYAVPLRDTSQWQVGDRMYFQCHHGYVDHAGMYIGNGYFIHSHIGAGVDVTKVAQPFYWNHLVAVRRSSEMLGDAQQGVSTAAPDTEQSQSE